MLFFKILRARTSYQTLGELEQSLAELKSIDGQTRIVTNRLSAFSRRVNIERYGGKLQIVHRNPLKT